MKKIVILLLAFCLIFSSCSNKPTTDVNAPTDKTNTKPAKTTAGLAIRRDVPLSPYETTDKINLDLLKLIFEPLFECTKDYNFNNVLAASYSFENNLLKVKLKSGIAFHDKSALTANDVVYSFNKAKGSIIYSSRLANITSAVAADNITVVFELKVLNTGAPALLDFPIIKTEKNLIGTGKYIYKSNHLEANPKYPKTIIKKIDLINVKSIEDLILNIENGKLSAVSVDSIDADDRLTGKLGSTAAVTVTNTLTYLGINTRKNNLKEANFRKALAFSIGRESLHKDVLSGAQMVFSPVNPLWKYFDKSAAPDAGLTEANNYFKSAGFAKASDGKWYKSSGWSRFSPSLSLLVNSDNRTKVMVAEKIAKELTSAGIQVTVVKASFASYKQRVSSGSYDLYLGEVKVPNDMDISQLVGSGGSLNKSGYGSSILDSQITLYKSAKDEGSKQAAAREYISILYKEMPIVPIYFNTTTLITEKTLDAGLLQTANNIYGGIENWKFK